MLTVHASMEGDVLTTQKVATAVVAQWVTLDLTVKRKLIIAVPVPVRMVSQTSAEIISLVKK